jgi:hypothetical protein
MDLIVVLTSVFTLGAGLSTYFIARRDLRPVLAAAVAVAAGLGVGIGFLLTVYLAVAAYVGAVVIWLLARRFLPRPGVALLVGAGAFGMGLAGSVIVMGYALSGMN